MININNKDYQNFVNRNILRCQTFLVEELIKKEHFLIDYYNDIVNLRKTDKELKNAGYDDDNIQKAKDNNEDEKEIFEWWLVDDWMLDKLEEAGEPVLRTDYENWWGRTCSGQAVYLDSIMQKIYEKYN